MPLIYTIGYEGTDIERFVATLKIVGIKHLADVRAVAVSRKKGFSKSALSARLDAEGIQYFHFIELGDPKPGRDAARAGTPRQVPCYLQITPTIRRSSGFTEKASNSGGQKPYLLALLRA